MPLANCLAPRREMLQNPEVLRRSLDPANVQAMLQMQQAMQQLQSSGFAPPLGGAGGNAGTSMGGGGALPATGGLDAAELLRSLGLGALGTGAPAGNPAELYASQQQQLQARPPSALLHRCLLLCLCKSCYCNACVKCRRWASLTAAPTWLRCSRPVVTCRPR